MRLCFIADARSPIAQNWIQYFTSTGHEVHLISTFPFDATNLEVASVHVVPVGFAELASGLDAAGVSTLPSRLRTGLALLMGSKMRITLSFLRHLVAPLELHRHTSKVLELVRGIQPDLVHAMRIPYEGLLAAEALREEPVPLLISVWGNDFTLFASHYPLIARLTRRAMRRANAIHPDCFRDLRLACAWGFDPKRPSLVVPGSGGVQMELFRPGAVASGLRQRFSIPEGAPVVLNPRGFREYVRNDTFFRAIPLVLATRPNVIFVGLDLAGNATAERWIQRLGIGSSVRLLPKVSRQEMAELFRMADILVSPTEHDGTPNTLIEGMACGAFPVAGDIESIREWVEHGVNGLLFDPTSPRALADALLRALGDEDLRSRAATYNVRLCEERADYRKVMAKAESFYKELYQRFKATY